MSGDNGASLTWLGQSGFLLETDGVRLACDLYLSDYCKQRSKLDHTRLMPIPISPEALPPVDHYLITHAHIDHFDPLTVGPVLREQPRTRFYCPPAGMAVVGEFFAEAENRFTLLDSGAAVELSQGVTVVALPAAHEELQKDAQDEYIAFSYLVLLTRTKQAVFFAGDTIPFDGQVQAIRDAVPQGYALTLVLPVNGRDLRRATLGFKGNLTAQEAVALYHATGAQLLVPCHFGMFALNDIPQPLTPEFFAANNCAASIPVVMKPLACATAATTAAAASCGCAARCAVTPAPAPVLAGAIASVEQMFSLRGRTALVTGSSRGIGKAIAQALAAAGATVIVHGSHVDDNLNETAREIRDAGGVAFAVAADLGDEAAVRRLAQESIAATGQLDILVMNASVQSYQTLEEFTPSELLRQTTVNLQSSCLLMQAVLPGMKERRWGRLLAIGSVNQWKPSPKLAVYAAGKCALASLLMNCAREYAPYGITANNLAPGVITTDRNRDALQDETYKQKVLNMIPAGRFGTPQECAGLALLICSEAGSYLTGADIPLTGGMHM